MLSPSLSLRKLKVNVNLFFFFQAEDGIRDKLVTGVQTCALPILSNSIGAAEKHLEANIGNAAPKFAQALPGIFVEKTQRSVERCPTPHFKAEETRQLLRDKACSGQQIVGPHARRHQRLMRIPKRRVR